MSDKILTGFFQQKLLCWWFNFKAFHNFNRKLLQLILSSLRRPIAWPHEISILFLTCYDQPGPINNPNEQKTCWGAREMRVFFLLVRARATTRRNARAGEVHAEVAYGRRFNKSNAFIESILNTGKFFHLAWEWQINFSFSFFSFDIIFGNCSINSSPGSFHFNQFRATNMLHIHLI